LIGIGLVAVWLAGIDRIEDAALRGEIEAAKKNELRWRGYATNSHRDGNIPSALTEERVADSCAAEQKILTARLGEYTSVLSPTSVAFTVLFWWAVILAHVRIVERAGKIDAAIAATGSRKLPAPFPVWLASGFVAPVIMFILVLGYEQPTPLFLGRSPSFLELPWPAKMIEILYLGHAIQALGGVVLLRGKRRVTLCLAILSLAVVGFVASCSLMSVLGVWL
jgi:hypothetical protein